MTARRDPRYADPLRIGPAIQIRAQVCHGVPAIATDPDSGGVGECMRAIVAQRLGVDAQHARGVPYADPLYVQRRPGGSSHAP